MNRRFAVALCCVVVGVLCFLTTRPKRFGSPVDPSRLPAPVSVTLRQTNFPLRVFPGVGGVLIRLQDGSLWQWGGQAGIVGRKVSPQQIGTNQNWTEAFIANNHCVGVQSDGTLWEWGYCGDGQMRKKPTQVGTNSDWVSIAAGDVHAIALKKDGTIWGWGDNASMQLGGIAKPREPTPVQINDDRDWKAIGCGQGSHSAALRADGSMWVWGEVRDNRNGGAPIVFAMPTRVCRETNWTGFKPGWILLGVAENAVWDALDSAPAPEGKREKVCRLLCGTSSALAFCGFPELFEIREGGTLFKSRLSMDFKSPPKNNWKQVGDRQDWIYLGGHSSVIGVTADGTIWTWGAELGLAPIPDQRSQVKILAAEIGKKFGMGPTSLQTQANAPYQSEPRPLMKIVRLEK
jgi:alpha-tubulin suppressor-like RCC1 family protein